MDDEEEDVEETGMTGADAFARSHPWRKDVDVVLNFEARGTRGPDFMFQTSDGNGALIREFAAAAPYPVATSLTYEIYTPDDTLRGRPAVRFDEGHARRRRIALGVLAFAVAIATTLAAIGSLEEAPTGRAETTSATVTPTVTTVAPTASATENATANATPAITFAPPLSPVPSAPRRRNLPRPLPKRLP